MIMILAHTDDRRKVCVDDGLAMAAADKNAGVLRVNFMEPTKPAGSRTRRTRIVASAVAAVLVLGSAASWFKPPVKPVIPASVPPQLASPTRPKLPDEATQTHIREFCGACHAMPAAEQFPRVAWYHEVERGFKFFNDSNRTDLHPPPLQQVLNYYQAQAPEQLVIPPPIESPRPSQLKFRIANLAPDAAQSETRRCAVSAVTWLHRQPGAPGELIYSDMRLGEVRRIGLGRDALTSELIARVPHPVVVRVCDLDGDGQTELVIADLGTYLPGDHQKGAVWWFKPGSSDEQGIKILTGIGRVAEIQVADFDADGDQDLLVGEFGWHTTGGIHVLENLGLPGTPQFKQHLLDQRSGTIHTPVADLNGDGRPDFVALLSQEHETAAAFLNTGKLQFKAQTLDQPQDPANGSSGLSLVDLDRDGDLDVLLTNGDTFDSFYLKPAHGIEWLENQGDQKFVRHKITPMPGVHRALAGDMDGDGDLDIVAVALIPGNLLSQQSTTEFDSLIWLEQTAPGKFERHRLESGQCHHAALELADFDKDGDLDLAVPNFADDRGNIPPALAVWWNLRVDALGIPIPSGG